MRSPLETARSTLFPVGQVGCFVFQVALLDIDICGPSIPKIMGLEGEQVSKCSNILFEGIFFLSFSLAYSGFFDVELLKGVHNGRCGAVIGK